MLYVRLRSNEIRTGPAAVVALSTLFVGHRRSEALVKMQT
ncbi:hypothetical protein PAMC26577_40580 [Caballeronia sordidicola]|uniref:Uncharacterized protein n=1 Tax=Caballeronia sordidicola TaxID=196367 RepID=A0A242M2N5_CABSO|nr:hypothetical protein PAMC26577_40580 [Caballeronia sordidicola]